MFISYHPWNFLILPLVVLSCGGCDTKYCRSSHWRLSLGWLVWTVHVDFSDEH